LGKKKGLQKLPPEVTDNLDKIASASFPAILPMLCLALIKKKSRHGYDIIKEVERMYKPFGLRPPGGSLVYPALHSLEEKGVIKSHWEKRKKVYSITPKGKKEVEDYKKFAKEMMKIRKKFLEELFEEKVI
jgi:DNA-binding PadR family transcriptional regulator